MNPDWFERAMSKTAVNPQTDCWEYGGEIVHNGYGRIWSAGRNVRVHRLSYLHFHGKIPTGLFVCHKCDVRNCWNPEHLFLGTHLDNMMDMVSKGRSPVQTGVYKRKSGNFLRGEAHPSAKLTDEKVREIRRLSKEDGTSQRKIASMFGTSPGRVADVIARRRWAHVS